MRKEIVVSFEFEAIHQWPDAKKIKGVEFLQHPHRHLFKCRAWKTVKKNDREIEFINFKRKILEYVVIPFGISSKDKNERSVGTMSCEDLAEKILKKFKLSKCEVLEDGENGAVVYK